VAEHARLQLGPLVNLRLGASGKEDPDVGEPARQVLGSIARGSETPAAGLARVHHEKRVAAVEDDVGFTGVDPTHQCVEIVGSERTVDELEETAPLVHVAVTREDEIEAHLPPRLAGFGRFLCQPKSRLVHVRSRRGPDGRHQLREEPRSVPIEVRQENGVLLAGERGEDLVILGAVGGRILEGRTAQLRAAVVGDDEHQRDAIGARGRWCGCGSSRQERPERDGGQGRGLTVVVVKTVPRGGVARRLGHPESEPGGSRGCVRRREAPRHSRRAKALER
jgi:hypothetical protein